MSVLGHLQSFFNAHTSPSQKFRKVLIACSGGSDSVALACALNDFNHDKSRHFLIGHVNHRLRGKSSQADEKFVQRLGQQLGWPVICVRAPITKDGNLEERARVARYEGLTALAKKHRADLILTGHTKDDQAETVFLNLLRGTGLNGLSGMAELRVLSGKILLGRPFLKATKADLQSYLKRRRQQFRLDRSNHELQFTRNWLRTVIFPKIEERFGDFKSRVSNLAQIVRDEQSFWLEHIAEISEEICAEKGSGCLLDFRGLMRYSPSVQRRVLRRIVGEGTLTFDGIEGWRQWMMAPPRSGRLWQLRKGWSVERLSKSKGAPSTQLFWVRHTPLKNIT